MDGSTAAGDDSVAPSEKSSDVAEEVPATAGQVAQLRKTLSCSAKGVLGSGKLMESASGPVLPTGSPVSPGVSPRCSVLAPSVSQLLHRESTGPLLLRRTPFPFPVAPAGVPGAPLGLIAHCPRESSPILAASPPKHSTQVRAVWGQQLQPGLGVQPALQPAVQASQQRAQQPAQQPVIQPAMQLPQKPQPRHSIPVQPMPAAQCALPAQAGSLVLTFCSRRSWIFLYLVQVVATASAPRRVVQCKASSLPSAPQCGHKCRRGLHLCIRMSSSWWAKIAPEDVAAADEVVPAGSINVESVKAAAPAAPVATIICFIGLSQTRSYVAGPLQAVPRPHLKDPAQIYAEEHVVDVSL